MRKALIVGINYYQSGGHLYGCVDDAHEISSVLDSHSDSTKNFDIERLTGTGDTNPVTKTQLRDAIESLFADDADVALFYFAGHGSISDTGGYLICSDTQQIADGYPLNDLLTLANRSRARSKIIVLDSCQSGLAGNPPTTPDLAMLSEGITIMTACAADQYAEENGKGVFTSLFVDALQGAAANLVGDITPGSVYAHIDQSLGAWQQRPIFKTNVKSFVSLRKTQPPISQDELRMITELFDGPGMQFKLDPSYEPDSDNPVEDNTRKFRVLQRYNRLNLVVPVGEEHMYYAAMNSKACKLTVLGEHYWNLVRMDRL